MLRLRSNDQHLDGRMQVCGAWLDPVASAAAADSFAQVNQAISDASYLRIMAGTEMTFFILRFVPFLSMMGRLGFMLLIFALPAITVWWLRFGKLRSMDPEFIRARRNTLLFGGGGAIFFVLPWIAPNILPHFLHSH